MNELSVVVPIYNEERNITSLHQEIVNSLRTLGTSYEIIYVNDGSTDGSLKILRGLKDATIIDLNRNYGQATALDAGFKRAEGKLVVTLDGDGQNDPKDIPALIAKLQKEHLDVVAGWRKDRRDRQNIRLLTVIGRTIRRIFMADIIHDSGCTLRVYRSEAVKSLDLGGEMHRYILALLRWKGFKIGEVVVNDRPRQHGRSKYNEKKALHGSIDLVYVWFIHKYSQRPLHFFGYFSIASFAGGVVTIAWSLYEKIFLGLSFNRNGLFFIAMFLLLASIIFFSFGIVIDLLVRLHLNNSPYEKRYYVREVIKV